MQYREEERSLEKQVKKNVNGSEAEGVVKLNGGGCTEGSYPKQQSGYKKSEEYKKGGVDKGEYHV